MMHGIRSLLLTGATLVASALQGTEPSGQVAIGMTARTAPRGSVTVVLRPLACPGTDFAAFLQAFGEDAELQRQYTRFPLNYVTVAEGPDEPTTRERWLPADSLSWPLLPPSRVRVWEGLELAIDSTTAGQWNVTVARPDTDYQLRYRFVRGRGPETCWQLAWFENASL